MNPAAIIGPERKPRSVSGSKARRCNAIGVDGGRELRTNFSASRGPNRRAIEVLLLVALITRGFLYGCAITARNTELRTE